MKIGERYEMIVVGNPEDGFTSAEITELGNGAEIARVFELESGWYIHAGQPEVLREPLVVEAVLAAKSELTHYVNRRGGVPDGLSVAGASFWLMQRDDGKGFSAP